MRRILYIGSGNSSKLIEKLPLEDFYVVALNNAHRHFNDKPLDCWIHSGDFPSEWRPKDLSNIRREVTHPEYETTLSKLVRRIGIKQGNPAFFVGYTMFFQGLYFLAEEFKPESIYLLGFDHDYDPEKVKKWKEAGQPNPQNNFKRTGGETITASLEETFKENNKDSFYGHGTPDPLRLGEDYLRTKFELAKSIFMTLNIKLINLSPVSSAINTVRREPIEQFIWTKK